MARARALRDATVHHCFDYLGSQHPDSELEGSARSVYNLRAYSRKPYHALRMRRSTSVDRLVLWLTFANSFNWLYIWSAASTLNMTMASGIHFVRKHIISVLATNTVRPDALHMTTITPVIFLSCSGGCEAAPASSAYVARDGSPAVATPRPPAPPLPFFSKVSCRHTVYSKIANISNMLRSGGG